MNRNQKKTMWFMLAVLAQSALLLAAIADPNMLPSAKLAIVAIEPIVLVVGLWAIWSEA